MSDPSLLISKRPFKGRGKPIEKDITETELVIDDILSDDLSTNV